MTQHSRPPNISQESPDTTYECINPNCAGRKITVDKSNNRVRWLHVDTGLALCDPTKNDCRTALPKGPKERVIATRRLVSGTAVAVMTESMGTKTPPRESCVIEAAVDFLASEPGRADRALAKHRKLADGLCAGCLTSLTRWPCPIANIALMAQARPRS